jgi:hypothetical protein
MNIPHQNITTIHFFKIFLQLIILFSKPYNSQSEQTNSSSVERQGEAKVSHTPLVPLFKSPSYHYHTQRQKEEYEKKSKIEEEKRKREKKKSYLK